MVALREFARSDAATVLLTEDDPDIRELVAVFLDGAGNVYVAELGFRAGTWPGADAPGADAPGGRVSVFDRHGTLLA